MRPPPDALDKVYLGLKIFFGLLALLFVYAMVTWWVGRGGP